MALLPLYRKNFPVETIPGGALPDFENVSLPNGTIEIETNIFQQNNRPKTKVDFTIKKSFKDFFRLNKYRFISRDDF